MGSLFCPSKDRFSQRQQMANKSNHGNEMQLEEQARLVSHGEEMDEVMNISLKTIATDTFLGNSDTAMIPTGSLFCKCAAIPGQHEIRKGNLAPDKAWKGLAARPDVTYFRQTQVGLVESTNKNEDYSMRVGL